MDASITPVELTHRLAAFPPPTLVDVRRQPAFEQDQAVIPGAIRRLPETVDAWAGAIEPWRDVVVYCVRGHEVGQNAAAALRAEGLDARYVAGGLEQWRAEGHATKPFAVPTRWVTRERPKIDRIACPWLVRRFIDPSAEFFYVPNAEVRDFAAANGATAYDIPEVPYSHVGTQCSFDAFIRLHKLDHPALSKLAMIVRGADTGAPELAHEAPGLLASSLGLSAMFADDHTMLKWGMLIYDSLYAWCREAQTETHGWFPEKLRSAATP
ncbi:MAG: chromate resistance protein ChrB domain-containing protein [Betaproteobacteria bacterium]